MDRGQAGPQRDRYCDVKGLRGPGYFPLGEATPIGCLMERVQTARPFCISTT